MSPDLFAKALRYFVRRADYELTLLVADIENMPTALRNHPGVVALLANAAEMAKMDPRRVKYEAWDVDVKATWRSWTADDSPSRIAKLCKSLRNNVAGNLRFDKEQLGLNHADKYPFSMFVPILEAGKCAICDAPYEPDGFFGASINRIKGALGHVPIGENGPNVEGVAFVMNGPGNAGAKKDDIMSRKYMRKFALISGHLTLSSRQRLALEVMRV